MGERLNCYATFEAAFTPPKTVAETTGQELADLLVEELPNHGLAPPKVIDGDFCQFVDCQVGASTIELMVGFEQGNDYEDRWYMMVCARRTLFGRKDPLHLDCRALLVAVNEVLQAAEAVTDVRWYPYFEGLGTLPC